MLYGVTIGEKHSLDDFDVYLKSKTISAPEVQTKYVEVPMRDGSIDMTESLTGTVKYKDRKIKMNFKYIGKYEDIWTKISEIENYLHGKRMKLVFDDDFAYFYTGRLTVDNASVKSGAGEFTITGVVEPYKYDNSYDGSEWLWDPFNFETGYISDVSFDVDGTFTAHLMGMDKETYPVITTTADMEVLFNGDTFTLSEGKNVVYDLILTSGMNDLIFTGTGHVEIGYTGGTL
jgi:predicted phage tail component-like protein